MYEAAALQAPRPIDPGSVGVLVVQTLAQLVLAAVSFGAHRLLRRPALILLAWSWIGLAVYQVAALLVAVTGTSGDQPLRILVSAVAQAAGLASVLCLLLGVRGLVRDGVGVPAWTRWMIAAAAAVGVVLVLLTVGSSADTRLLWRVGLRSSIAAVALFAAAVLVFRSEPGRLGRCLVTCGFVGYGLVQLGYLAVGVDRSLAALLAILPPIDLFTLLTTGLGLVIVLLEHERRRAAATLDALQTSESRLLLAARAESMGRVASGIAHDFRNLLTAVRGSLELALGRTPTGDPSRPDLENSWRATCRAVDLTERLRGPKDSPANPPAACDVANQLRELRQLLRPTLGDSIEVRVDAPGAPLLVAIEAARLEQVLVNLILNARDAMPAGGRLTLTAAAIAESDGTEVEIRVADTGPGLDGAVQARLFEPFFTTKAGGMGLGLSQAAAIVTEAGGRIRAGNASSGGALFVISLPAGDASHLTRPRSAPSPRPDGDPMLRD